jgi:hypothetical protein
MQPNKNAFILSLPRLDDQAIYTPRLAASKLVRAPGVPGCRVGLLRCTLRNGSGPCKLLAGLVSTSEALRDITENDPVLRSTLSCSERPGSARANRLADGENASRRERTAATPGLDRPDQYGLGWCAAGKPPGPKPARHAGRAGGIVQDHDGTGQVVRFKIFISIVSSGNFDAVSVSRADQP